MGKHPALRVVDSSYNTHRNTEKKEHKCQETKLAANSKSAFGQPNVIRTVFSYPDGRTSAVCNIIDRSVTRFHTTYAAVLVK